MSLPSPRLFLPVLCTLALPWGWLTAAPASAATTPEQTRREFLEMCHQLRQSDNEYYGVRHVVELGQRLQRADQGADAQARGLQKLGLEQLRLGQNAEAQENLQLALQLASQARLDVRLQMQILMDLGLASLRLGEVSNCIGHHTPEMCIFPISEGGRHVDRRGSEAAVRAFTGVLSGIPGHIVARWLLNVAAMTLGTQAELPPALRIPPRRLQSSESFPAFAETAHHAGLHINDTSGGALIDDFTGDGHLDVVTSAIDPCSHLRFFVNDGRGHFAEGAEAAGLHGQLGGLNMVHADVDNDGDLDILVLRGGWFGADGQMRNSLLLNGGSGNFVDVTAEAGLATPAYPTQTAAWADYDLDGDLDLYIGNEGPYGGAYPSQLFRNDLDAATGRLRFTDVTRQAGVADGVHWTKGVAWGDYDDDGDPDLYTSNLGPNRLWRNNGNGTFTDVAPQLGVDAPRDRSFATWFFDYDNDGDLDLWVNDYNAGTIDIARFYFAASATEAPVTSFHPRLYRNDGADPQAPGGHRFTEISRQLGLGAPALPMGSNFGDLDNDGFLDVYLGTGVPPFEALMPNLMYRNDGGQRFVDVSFAGRFGHLQKGHGVAFADVDEDGDQDVFEQMGGAYPGDNYPSVLYRNPGFKNHWLKLRLHGQRSNRAAIGARLTLTFRDGARQRSVHRLVGTGGSFGGSPLRQEIGVGQAQKIDSLEVRWPGGGVQTFTDVAVGTSYELTEGGALRAVDEPAPRTPAPRTPAPRTPAP